MAEIKSMWKQFVILVIISVILIFSIQPDIEPPTSRTILATLNNNQAHLILPFHLVGKNLSRQIMDILNREWGKKGIKYNTHFISESFDELYAMLDNANKLIGFVGIDHEYIKPFISHLYVVEKSRHNGYGKKLLQLAEKYCSCKKYNPVYLWSESEMVMYYQRQGWVTSNFNRVIIGVIGKVLMSKSLEFVDNPINTGPTIRR